MKGLIFLKILVNLIDGSSIKETCNVPSSILNLSHTDQQLMSNTISSLVNSKTQFFIFEDGSAVPISSILSIELVDKNDDRL